MPLAQARDSLLNLKDLSTQHTDSSSRYSFSDTSTASDNRNNGANANQHQQSHSPLVRLDSSCSEESWVVEDYFRYWVLGNSDLEYHTELVPLVPETGFRHVKSVTTDPLYYDTATTTTNHRPKAQTRKEKRSCFLLFTFCSTSDEYSDDETDEEDASLVSTEGSSSTESAHKSSPTRRHGGILKSASMAVQLVEGINVGERVTFQPTCFEPRVPCAHSVHSHRKRRVHFSPLKSVVSICPLDCMTSKERKSVWWQAADFDHFKNSITILSKQTEEKSSCNTWLVWSRTTTKSSGKAYKATSNSSKGKATLASPKAPNKKMVRQSSTVRQRKKTTSVNEKSAWWHKYGDSRRGLEKYASAMQAKQSMEVYKEAIHRVFDEQKHQKSLLRRHRPTGDEELARVYREYTGWARDLALAAAASDADALRTGFDDSKRKSREYFLLKQVYMNGMKIHRHIPAFMIPTGVKPKGYLDEHLSNCRSPKEKHKIV